MMMNAHWLVSILCATCAQLTVASQNCTLIDAKLSATFRGEDSDDTFGLLTDLRMRGADDSVLLPGGGSLAAWSASFVGTGTGLARTSSRGTCANRKVLAASGTAASFQWTDCVVTLPPGPPPPPSPGPVVWQQHKQSNCAGRCLPGHSSGPKGGNCQRLPGCGHDAGLPFCEVEAMKAHCLNVSGCTEFNLNGYLYGGSNAAVPFSDYPLECWAIGGGAPTAPARVNVTMDVSLSEGLLEFWITFDADGSLSLWDYTISLSGAKVSATTKTVGTSAARQLTGLYDSAVPAGSAVYFAAHDPTGGVKACGASADSGTGSMHCTVDALDATLPLYQYKAAFPLVVTVVAGDWWDLASVYRRWVTSNAAWTRLGPLSTRTDMPDWLENLTMWMNNNWGGDPLGPNYGGDPEHVKNEMLQVNAALNLTAHGGHLALHWYEWDTLGYALGSNHTQCDRVGAPCGFDTHYPNYFPARVGCKESIKAMQEAGMRVIPYINGQLFDTLISRWQDDNASLATQKFVAQTMKTADKDPPLTPHLEHFDGITSAVMCPHTKYWHDVMSATIQTIVNELGFDGCYVDQVGNGEKRNCGDPSHNHTIHGGSFWAEAFYSIMAEVRARVPAKTAMFMTEGIAEEVSGRGFDILLGLRWTELPFWSAIYGGYGYATGSAGSIRASLSGGLCSELTQQFMAGGTMGWLTYQNYGTQFFEAANAPYVQYIRELSKARIAAKPWMVHGRATRTLQLHDDTGTLNGGCFLREKPGETVSVVCAIALPTKGPPARYSLAMQPVSYGLAVSASGCVALADLQTGEALGTFSGNVTHSALVPALGVQLLKLTVAAAENCVG